MTKTPGPPSEVELSRKQVVLGLITIFSLQFTISFFLQTLGIARPRMAADLNGMSLYSWSLSIPGLAAAFVTLLFSKFSDCQADQTKSVSGNHPVYYPFVFLS
jgi:hypothetical protein